MTIVRCSSSRIIPKKFITFGWLRIFLNAMISDITSSMILPSKISNLCNLHAQYAPSDRIQKSNVLSHYLKLAPSNNTECSFSDLSAHFDFFALYDDTLWAGINLPKGFINWFILETTSHYVFLETFLESRIFEFF